MRCTRITLNQESTCVVTAATNCLAPNKNMIITHHGQPLHKPFIRTQCRRKLKWDLQGRSRFLVGNVRIRWGTSSSRMGQTRHRQDFEYSRTPFALLKKVHRKGNVSTWKESTYLTVRSS